MPQPTSPQQRHRQQDSAAMSRHDQHHFDNAIVNKTQQCHNQRRLDNIMANIVSAAPLPARLSNDIMSHAMLPWQCHRRQDSRASSCHG
jgi:hypothetical protein